MYLSLAIFKYPLSWKTSDWLDHQDSFDSRLSRETTYSEFAIDHSQSPQSGILHIPITRSDRGRQRAPHNQT